MLSFCANPRRIQLTLGSSCRCTDGPIGRSGYALPPLPGGHLRRLDRASGRVQHPDLRHLRNLRQQEPDRKADSLDQSRHDCNVLRGHGRYCHCIQLYRCLDGIPLRPHGQSPFLPTPSGTDTDDCVRAASLAAQSYLSPCVSRGRNATEPAPLSGVWSVSAAPSPAG